MIHKCLTSENKCHCHTPNKFLGWKMILLWHQQGWPSLPLKGRWCSVVVVVRSPVFMTLLLYSFNDDEVAVEEAEEEGGAEWFCYLSFNCLHKCNSTSRMLGCVHPHQFWAESNVGTRHQGHFFVNTKVGSFYCPARPADDCWFSDRWKIGPMSDLWTGNKIKYGSGPLLLNECSKSLKSLWNWCLMLLFGHCSV